MNYPDKKISIQIKPVQLLQSESAKMSEDDQSVSSTSSESSQELTSQALVPHTIPNIEELDTEDLKLKSSANASRIRRVIQEWSLLIAASWAIEIIREVMIIEIFRELPNWFQHLDIEWEEIVLQFIRPQDRILENPELIKFWNRNFSKLFPNAFPRLPEDQTCDYPTTKKREMLAKLWKKSQIAGLMDEKTWNNFKEYLQQQKFMIPLKQFGESIMEMVAAKDPNEALRYQQVYTTSSRKRKRDQSPQQSSEATASAEESTSTRRKTRASSKKPTKDTTFEEQGEEEYIPEDERTKPKAPSPPKSKRPIETEPEYAEDDAKNVIQGAPPSQSSTGGRSEKPKEKESRKYLPPGRQAEDVVVLPDSFRYPTFFSTQEILRPIADPEYELRHRAMRAYFGIDSTPIEIVAFGDIRGLRYYLVTLESAETKWATEYELQNHPELITNFLENPVHINDLEDEVLVLYQMQKWAFKVVTNAKTQHKLEKKT